MKRSKQFQEFRKKVDRLKKYPLDEAVAVLKENHYAKFDESIEVAVRLGVNPKHADQMVRGTVALPNGTGKKVRVAVFAQGDKATEAQEAGADFVGAEDLAEKIKGGWTDFDVCIAAPDMMGVVGPLGKVLGPRGLMPNPKAGTVVPAEDLPRVVNESKAGRVEFRVDKTANLHVPIGKVSFEQKKLYENLATLMEAIKKARPAAAKGTYIKRVTLTSTMGPGIRVDAAQSQSMETGE